VLESNIGCIFAPVIFNMFLVAVTLALRHDNEGLCGRR